MWLRNVPSSYRPGDKQTSMHSVDRMDNAIRPCLHIAVVTVAECMHSCRHKLRVTRQNVGGCVGKVTVGPVHRGLQTVWETKGFERNRKNKHDHICCACIFLCGMFHEIYTACNSNRYRLPICNTSYHTIVLCENVVRCLAQAQCRRYEVQMLLICSVRFFCYGDALCNIFPVISRQ